MDSDVNHTLEKLMHRLSLMESNSITTNLRREVEFWTKIYYFTTSRYFVHLRHYRNRPTHVLG
jgi:guanylate kinase